jgi:uncharacterized protein YcbK (DUF882 family)
MRAKFGPCHVLSAYRHFKYNQRIGGASDSRHVWDKHPGTPAFDLSFAEGTPEQWGNYARQLMARNNEGHGGVGKYKAMRFCHVDLRPWAANWRGSGE